ncbi:CHAT domain-containing protein [Corallococcus sicarius]|nr:CHAT domain-containing protein [Corallococcus sicarius]
MLKSKKKIFEEARKGFQALQEEKAYDLALAENPESWNLRLRAQSLVALGRREQALPLFHRALALHTEKDDTAAAAAARHDLAHALADAQEDLFSLTTARQLYTRALESPVRQRAPLRYAETESSLAVCLRRMAQLLAREDQAPLFEEIERRYRGALWRLKDCGQLGLQQRSEVHLNLANFLGTELGEVERAIREYDRAMECAQRAKEIFGASRNDIPLRSQLSSASLLRARGRKQDRKRAEQLAKEVIQTGDPQYQALARMELAEIILGGDAPERAAHARTLLEQVRWNVLDQFKHLRHLAALLRRADGPKAAIELLSGFIEKAIQHRAEATISDSEADAASIDLQQAAEAVACILAQDQQDALSAFLALENTSGFRFAENLSSRVRRPEEPLAKALYRELAKHMGQTYMLDSFTQSIRRQAPDGQREFLDKVIPQLDQHPEDESSTFILPRCIAARKAPVPSEYFEAQVEKGRQQVARLRYALAREDKNYAETQHILNQNLGTEELTEVLRQHPGHVLIRIFVQELELLTAAVWLEGGELMARSSTCPIRPEVFSLLRQAAEQSATFTKSELLSKLLQELDFSAALPPGVWTRAVLLPSHVSTFLPLAALGPAGHRLIDRFESIIWLPSLFPLRTRPAPTPPRRGEWVVIPGGTHFHPIAFQALSPGERCLEGDEATLEAIQGALAEARTLSIYTHGEHTAGEWPRLEIKGGTLDFSDLEEASLNGMERVEVWACQSGANLPHDPLTRPANEGYGLDHILLTSGVRTAIGAQWSVPDLVTAILAREYRRRLAAGDEPAQALTGAQRRWLEQSLPLLLESLRRLPVNEAIVSFAETLGLPPEQDIRGPVLGMLGPVADQMSEHQVGELEARLACPVAWAGIRFVGLPEWKSEKEWTPGSDRALTAEEQAQLEQLLAQEPPSPVSFDELQDSWLEREALPEPGEAPSPERALAVARVLRDRLNSSQFNNLLAALAWVHEALAVPGISPHEREQLSVEASHLWLEVAQRGDVRTMLPHAVPLARAEGLLAGLSSCTGDLSADAVAARARLSFLQRVHHREEEPDHAVQTSFEEVLPALERVTPGTFEALRVATTAAELIALGSPAVRARNASGIEALRKLVPRTWPHRETIAAFYRLHALLEQLGDAPLNIEEALAFLPPKELVAVVNHKAFQEGPRPGAGMLPKASNQALNRMEGAIWGYPSDDGSPLVRMTGTPGPAYRWMLNGYLAGHARAQPEDVVHLLACLQYSCDLRLSVLHRLARLPEALGLESLPPAMQYLWDLLRIRRLLHTTLTDATLFPSVDPALPGPHPHRLDPYAVSSQALVQGLKVDTDLTAWTLGETCLSLRKEETRPPHTAAFEAISLSAWIEASIAKTWETLLEADAQGRKLTGIQEFPGVTSFIEPGRDLDKNEKALRNLSDGHGVLGLVIEPQGELLIMACWNDGHSRGQRTFRLEKVLVQGALMGVLHPSEQDATSGRGTSSDMRRNSWRMVEEQLAPVLESLLRTAQARKKLKWSVLAPGALRELPLLGLKLAGGLLAHQVEALVHMPSIAFSLLPREQEAEDFTACLLARDREEGTTGFGEAAVETLRRVQPPHLVVDPAELSGNRVVEVGTLEPQASRIRTLRLYGVGKADSLNDTMSLMQLEGRRALRERNTHGMLMPRCKVVELWACTAGSAGMLLPLRNDGDRIPGLAASFLANGALAVIDLAWPVHDIVKALVCEQYGLMRRRIGHRPEALKQALCMTHAALQELRSQAAQRTVRQVLELIDHLRRSAASIVFNVDPGLLVPFTDSADSPLVAGLDGEELVEELCQPAHLAAFRWWGA